MSMTFDMMMMNEVSTLQARIGGPPWTNNYNDGNPPQYIKDTTTHNLLEWCKLRGMPQEKVFELKRDQLEKCYCIKNYFDVVANKRPARDFSPKMPKKNRVLDVENILNETETITEKKILIDALGSIAALPSYTAQSYTQSPPQDPIRELLSAVETTIEKKLYSLREDIKQTLNTVTQNIAQVGPAVLDNIKSSLEDGTIDFKISHELEKKIHSVVQKTTDEVVFQALRNNIRHLERTREIEPEPELDLGEILLYKSVSSSPFIPVLDHKFHFDAFASRVIRKALDTGRHVYLHGPVGCGKTMLVEQVCALLGHGLFRINPHDGITREFFLGGMKLKNGETFFQDGALPIAMRNGLALLVDEFSFLPPNLAAILHPVLERNGKLFIPETGEILKASPGFCVLATDNTGGKGDSTGQFTGTEAQNTATLDRFDYSVVMDYLLRTKEEEMFLERFRDYIEVDSPEHTELDNLISLAKEVRNAFARGELAITLSTRKLIAFFEQRQQGFSFSETLSLCLLSWLDDDDRELVKTFLDRLNIKLEE